MTGSIFSANKIKYVGGYIYLVNMPKGGAWSNSNKTRMLSNVSTTQNQGGGEKKAGGGKAQRRRELGQAAKSPDRE
jgi:hypothetical protein